MQSLKVRVEGGGGGGGGAQFLSHYLTILDIKIIFSIVSNHSKILNLTSDPIIIPTLLCPFITFF